MLLYYITDRLSFSGDESSRRRQLLDKIAEVAGAGVNYIQLREKDLPARVLELLAKEAAIIIREAQLSTANSPLPTALLINSRTDIALAVQASGVNLRSDDVTPQEVRAVWHKSRGPKIPLISISCHSIEDVNRAAANRAALALFSPVFEKSQATPTGLDHLRQACRAKIPVLALGGITLQNATSCLEAGAAGIAAIRLFQENNVASVVRALCSGS